MRQLGRAVLAAFLVCACGGPETGSDGGGRDGQAIGVDGGPVTVCSAPGDCDDGQHCNGTERCEPGAAGAGADGCVAGTAPCGAGETCDEGEDSCVPDDCAEPDADNDGHDRIGCGAGDDCDDDDSNRYPGNFEVCDATGHDEDCNPATISGNPDADGDGHVDDACWNVRPDGTENRGTDCDDTRNTVHPAAPESCNGVDDDCDGMIDEGVLETFYRDVDGDNYGRTAETMMACSRPTGYALVGGDCDDGETGNAYAPTVNPAAVEVCNGRDDDCDGMIDPDCACTIGATQPCGIDIGECTIGTQTCVGGTWGACDGSQGPVTEVCNGLDDDCDGTSDEGLRVSCYTDADSDGHGTGSASSQCRDASRAAVGFCPAGYSDVAGDCNDGNGAVRPMATEICNGVDDDCDGMSDEGVLTQFWRDADGDGYGNAGLSMMACTAPAGYVSRADDCDDTPVTGVGTNPAAREDLFPCDGLDNDCDGTVDETEDPTPGGPAVGRMTCYRDQDEDGYGWASNRRLSCTCTGGWVANSSDCQDTGSRAALIHPGASSYQSVGHCDGGATSCVNGGRAGCMRYTSCPGCPGGMGIPYCGPASFDYNCDGAAHPEPSSCSLTCIGGGVCVCGGRAPTTSHSADECGDLVTYAGCNAACDPVNSPSSEPLRCR